MIEKMKGEKTKEKYHQPISNVMFSNTTDGQNSQIFFSQNQASHLNLYKNRMNADASKTFQFPFLHVEYK